MRPTRPPVSHDRSLVKSIIVVASPGCITKLHIVCLLSMKDSLFTLSAEQKPCHPLLALGHPSGCGQVRDCTSFFRGVSIARLSRRGFLLALDINVIYPTDMQMQLE